MQLQTIVYSRGQCIDIIPSQPKTYFVTKMYSIVFIAKLDFFTISSSSRHISCDYRSNFFQFKLNFSVNFLYFQKSKILVTLTKLQLKYGSIWNLFVFFFTSFNYSGIRCFIICIIKYVNFIMNLFRFFNFIIYEK